MEGEREDKFWKPDWCFMKENLDCQTKKMILNILPEVKKKNSSIFFPQNKSYTSLWYIEQVKAELLWWGGESGIQNLAPLNFSWHHHMSKIDTSGIDAIFRKPLE